MTGVSYRLLWKRRSWKCVFSNGLANGFWNSRFLPNLFVLLFLILWFWCLGLRHRLFVVQKLWRRINNPFSDYDRPLKGKLACLVTYSCISSSLPIVPGIVCHDKHSGPLMGLWLKSRKNEEQEAFPEEKWVFRCRLTISQGHRRPEDRPLIVFRMLGLNECLWIHHWEDTQKSSFIYPYAVPTLTVWKLVFELCFALFIDFSRHPRETVKTDAFWLAKVDDLPVEATTICQPFDLCVPRLDCMPWKQMYAVTWTL